MAKLARDLASRAASCLHHHLAPLLRCQYSPASSVGAMSAFLTARLCSLPAVASLPSSARLIVEAPANDSATEARSLPPSPPQTAPALSNNADDILKRHELLHDSNIVPNKAAEFFAAAGVAQGRGKTECFGRSRRYPPSTITFTLSQYLQDPSASCTDMKSVFLTSTSYPLPLQRQ